MKVDLLLSRIQGYFLYFNIFEKYMIFFKKYFDNDKILNKLKIIFILKKVLINYKWI